MLPTITNGITLANCGLSIMGTIFRSVPLSTLPSLQRWRKSWRKKAHNNEDKDGSNSPNQTYLQGDLSSTKTSCALNLWDSLQIRAPSLINSIESPASADASIRYPIAQISTSWPCPSRKISGEWFSFINSGWANVGGVVASSQSIKNHFDSSSILRTIFSHRISRWYNGIWCATLNKRFQHLVWTSKRNDWFIQQASPEYIQDIPALLSRRVDGKRVEILERISSVFAQANHWNVFYLERIS